MDAHILKYMNEIKRYCSAYLRKETDLNMLNLVIRPRYFDAIKSGSKTVEGRLNTPKFKDLKLGDAIIFTCDETNEKISCVVTALHIYPDFEAMLVSEGIENMLPGVENLAEGVVIYESFPGYQDGVKELGALAIRIKKDFK